MINSCKYCKALERQPHSSRCNRPEAVGIDARVAKLSEEMPAESPCLPSRGPLPAYGDNVERVKQDVVHAMETAYAHGRSDERMSTPHGAEEVKAAYEARLEFDIGLEVVSNPIVHTILELRKRLNALRSRVDSVIARNEELMTELTIKKEQARAWEKVWDKLVHIRERTDMRTISGTGIQEALNIIDNLDHLARSTFEPKPASQNDRLVTALEAVLRNSGTLGDKQALQEHKNGACLDARLAFWGKRLRGLLFMERAVEEFERNKLI